MYQNQIQIHQPSCWSHRFDGCDVWVDQWKALWFRKCFEVSTRTNIDFELITKHWFSTLELKVSYYNSTCWERFLLGCCPLGTNSGMENVPFCWPWFNIGADRFRGINSFAAGLGWLVGGKPRLLAISKVIHCRCKWLWLS